MKSEFKIAVIFDPETIHEKRTSANKIIYSKNPDENRKNKIVEKLEKKAAEDSLKFKQRRLSSLFNPVFNGCIFLSEGIKLNGEEFINFGDAFFCSIEENFGIDVVNYNLIDAGGRKKAEGYKRSFFDFEIFNYNFDLHKAVKSEFIKLQNIKKINEIAEAVLNKNKPSASARPEAVKKPAIEPEKHIKGKKPEKPAVKAGGKSKPGLKTEKASEQKRADFEAAKAGRYAESRGQEEEEIPQYGISKKEISETCETETEKNIGEQIDIISSSWKLLSPVEDIPVLEAGKPVEISKESSVRIYFQKPGVRQVVWRFRKKPESGDSMPILRVYKDGDMLWYEVLEGMRGSRYIIFPEGLELSRTWVEIGYLTEKGGFIFIARSPAWPPDCLLKKLPELKLDRKLPKSAVLIGATESIPGGKNLPVNFTNSGAGFSGSGAGVTASGKGIK